MVSYLNEIIQVMHSVYGTDISMLDEPFLLRTIEKRLIASKSNTPNDYVDYLSRSRSEGKKLTAALNVTYTEFFRNSLTFAHLEQWVLPKLIEEKKDKSELRVWSAGCSSGEEPYSIAVLLERICAINKKPFRYRIIATDISQAALAKANKGEYNKAAIQNIKIKDLEEFFVKSGETYTVSKKLREHVSFSTYDLSDGFSSYPKESIFGDFDLIICCNLLFYYKPEHQRYILKKLIYSMAQHGCLVTGETEKHFVAKDGDLKIVVAPSPIFQKRN